MNVSGIAMTRAAPNRENAVKLMEFLVGELAQKMYAEQNNEYPLAGRGGAVGIAAVVRRFQTRRAVFGGRGGETSRGDQAGQRSAVQRGAVELALGDPLTTSQTPALPSVGVLLVPGIGNRVCL